MLTGRGPCAVCMSCVRYLICMESDEVCLIFVDATQEELEEICEGRCPRYLSPLTLRGAHASDENDDVNSEEDDDWW